jgi:hypothetical protein
MPSVKIPGDLYAIFFSLRSRYGTGHGIAGVLREIVRRLHESDVTVLTATDHLKRIAEDTAIIREDTAAIRQLLEQQSHGQTLNIYTVK